MNLARRRVDWDHTAAICAILVNVNLPKGKQRVTPDQMNPYASQQRRKPQKADISVLKVFLPKR